MSDPCIFCDVAGGKLDTKLLYEDDDVVAFSDIRPIAPAHILVVPKRHYATLAEAAQAGDDRLLGRLLSVAATLAAQTLEQSAGFRVVINNGAAAGQTVHHLHLHLLSGRHFAWPPG